ncbi:hypothetical protein [Paraburkholderia solisilvae]|uniref:Uncharacterized protein n=2 Tax=Paraburkholderia TaxID=1822464 RepID=A0A6J5E183_9BURK|nr:hypothetical protein [Paraburkholderia solisilvae]CAB3759474.1 hypothetical protein LMG29739_03164 [Paraburkholderia solisilvae]
MPDALCSLSYRWSLSVPVKKVMVQAARQARARKLLIRRANSEWQFPVDFSGCSQIPEVAMSIFSYRKHLRFLTHSQRRRWWDQKKRLTPRVKISGAYVPPSVTREFTYVKVG